MKKSLFITFFITISVISNAQKNVEFYINNKTQKITEIKCGETNIDDLQIKIPAITSEGLKYDKILIKLIFHHWDNGNTDTYYALKEYIDRDEINNLIKKGSFYLKVFNPHTNFRFGYGTRPLQDKSSYTPLSSSEICSYPQERLHLQNDSIIIRVGFYNVYKTEKVYDDRTNSWRNEYYYTLKKVFATGKIPVKLKAFNQNWVDDNKTVKINYINSSYINKCEFNSNNSCMSIINYQIFKEVGAYNRFKFNIDYAKKSDIETIPLYQKIKKKATKKGIDYTPYKFIEDVIENKIGLNSCSNVSSFNNPDVYNGMSKYKKAGYLDDCGKFIILKTFYKNNKYHDLSIHNLATTGKMPKDPITLWEQEIIGDKTFDVIKTEKSTIIDNNQSEKTTYPFFIYLYQTDDYIYKVTCGYGESSYDSFDEMSDEDIKFVKETVSKMKFLK